ncbi:hypothetical protein [Rhizobium sp. RU35A]|uniref:hypothetical protein n=1 Tax=Rhizobium sp. RU35A TaxID=1907414 RepID=UPI00122CF944|nr:hypothetical protein [Rhizobium sp. RU35A]
MERLSVKDKGAKKKIIKGKMVGDESPLFVRFSGSLWDFETQKKVKSFPCRSVGGVSALETPSVMLGAVFS